MTARLKPATVVQHIEDWLVFILHDSQAEGCMSLHTSRRLCWFVVAHTCQWSAATHRRQPSSYPLASCCAVMLIWHWTLQKNKYYGIMVQIIAQNTQKTQKWLWNWLWNIGDFQENQVCHVFLQRVTNFTKKCNGRKIVVRLVDSHCIHSCLLTPQCKASIQHTRSDKMICTKRNWSLPWWPGRLWSTTLVLCKCVFSGQYKDWCPAITHDTKQSKHSFIGCYINNKQNS